MAMKLGVSLISLLLLSACVVEAKVFDVRNFGAKSNGEISQALMSAWKAACAAPTRNTVLIPAGTFKSNEVLLEGPCKAPISMSIQGTLQANGDPKSFKTDAWIIFRHIDGFTLSGGGTFDGMGSTTWAGINCHEKKDCPRFALNLRFDFITNGLVNKITSLNSKNFHINLLGCKNLKFQHINIVAPARSPNTDGIHLGRSNEIYITDSAIKTGDDCISIGDGSQQVHIERVTCGPGHGISIGSLGKYADEEQVFGIFVKNCTLINTDNGVRIKTWPSSPGHSTASDMHFEDINMINVANPVLIDQEYCPWSHCNLGVPSKVKISNVSFKNIRGTSSTQDAVKLVCSKALPCENVEIGNINLAYHGLGGPAITKLANVHPKVSGILPKVAL